jgi:hypothetical protein
MSELLAPLAAGDQLPWKLDPDDEMWADHVGALDALDLVIDAIGGPEPRRD